MRDVKPLQQIRVIVTDVDGVLTDGQVAFCDDGHTATIFSIQDGMMIWIGRKLGFQFGWLSGRFSPSVQRRAAELQVDHVALGVWDKKAIFLQWMQEHGWKKEETLFIGDDLNDLPLSSVVGLFAAVQNASPEVKKRAPWILSRPGGNGAFREAMEAILKAQGKWQAVLEMFS